MTDDPTYYWRKYNLERVRCEKKAAIIRELRKELLKSRREILKLKRGKG